MTKTGYYFTRMLAIAAVFGLAVIASSCASTPSTYSTPAWASGVSDGSVPYYYFPDYGMYYDAGAGQYYYPNNGAWVTSGVEPYQGVDLNDAYMIELDRNVQRPWMNNDYYARNYPPHERQQYEQVVRDHNIIPNVPQDHAIVPMAYDENTNRMMFEERAQQARAAQQGARPDFQPQQRVAVHQVPMQTIAPNMPAQARGYRWGGAAKGR